MLPLLLSIFIAVGEPAPALQVDDATWQNTEKPLTIENLRGKVILLRWFTEKSCPYCKASAPALNAWNEKYADEGLQVIGIYHHKRTGKPQAKLVEDTAELYGFQFPVVIDQDWKTLNSWWLDTARETGERRWTSISVLIGKDGKIRYIHPGGSYEKGEPAYTELEDAIKSALNE